MQKTILIVDDDENIRNLLKKVLLDNNFNVMVAVDGAQALEIIEKTRADLVLLDLILPKVSGETVCMEIKKNHPETIVIILTAKSQSTDVVRSLRIGADDYISKPFVIEELLARIEARFKTAGKKNPAQKTALSGLNKVILRESIALIAIRLISAQLVFGTLFFLEVLLISFLSNYININNLLFLYFILLITLLIIDGVVIFSIVLKWRFEYMEITGKAIIKYSGIFHKKERNYTCNFIETITLRQNLLGMLFNFGTLDLNDPALKDPIYLPNITSPKKYSQIIEKIFSKKSNQSISFITQ